MEQSITGIKRVDSLLRKGAITKPYQWVDAYNQRVYDTYSGTIKARINDSNSFVTVPFNNNKVIADGKVDS